MQDTYRDRAECVPSLTSHFFFLLTRLLVVSFAHSPFLIHLTQVSATATLDPSRYKTREEIDAELALRVVRVCV